MREWERQEGRRQKNNTKEKYRESKRKREWEK